MLRHQISLVYLVCMNLLNTVNRKLISKIICLSILILFASHLYIKSNSSDYLFLFIFCVLIVIIPLILASIAWLIKKKWFHKVFIISSIIIFITIFVIDNVIKNNEHKISARYNSAERYFANKVGFFTRYVCIISASEYPDSILNSERCIVKCLYKVGGVPKKENYYIGKVLLNKRYEIIKEFYNKKAFEDTALLYKDFRASLSDAAILSTIFKFSGDSTMLKF